MTSHRLMRGVAIVMAIGFALLAGVSAYFGLRAQAFLSRGIEREARVVALERAVTQYRAGTTYHYLLETGDQRSMAGLRVQVPVGATLFFLELPEGGPESVVPGRRADGWFAIFSSLAGGTAKAVFALALGIASLLVGPWLVARIWRAPVR